jgi:adenosine deaminase CECR1
MYRVSKYFTHLAKAYRSVRDRHGSPDDPNRPIMTAADSPKKRKRMGSPLPSRRKPIPSMEPKIIDTEAEPVSARTFFETALGDLKAMNEYAAKHNQLIQRENETAWDRDARPKPTSRSQNDKDEQEVANIIRALRDYERKVVFGNQASEAIPGKETLDMGGQFLTNKERINGQSELFKIAHRVPKGGLLHLHFNAELHPERLLQKARDMDRIYIRSFRPLLTEKDLDETEMVLSVLDPEKVVKGVNIFSKDYLGNATNWKSEEMKWRVWMPWEQFRGEFPTHFPQKYVQPRQDPTSLNPTCCGEPGADIELSPAEYWLKSKMVLSETEAYAFDQTVNG